MVTELVDEQVTITDLKESFMQLQFIMIKTQTTNLILSYQFLKKNLVLATMQKFFLDHQVLMRLHFI